MPLPPLTKDVFLDKLLSDYRGQIIVCNILGGLNGSLYDTNYIKEIFSWWLDLCNYNKITSSHTIIAMLNSLVFENMPRGFRPHIPKPDFKLLCRRKTDLINDSNKLTTVVSTFIFSILISNDDLRRLYSVGVEFPSDYSQPMKDDALKALMDLPEADRVFRLKAGAAIGNKKLVWFSMKDRMENILSSAVNSADAVRDVLGLVHRKPDDVIIALYLSAKVLNHVNCARPTFADASTNTRFKAIADEVLNRKRSSWGHTAHLDYFANKRSSIDGLPERITSPIDQAAMVDAPINRFIPLGKVTTLRGHTVDDDDAEYARRLLSVRNIHQLKVSMLGII